MHLKTKTDICFSPCLSIAAAHAFSIRENLSLAVGGCTADLKIGPALGATGSALFMHDGMLGRIACKL